MDMYRVGKIKRWHLSFFLATIASDILVNLTWLKRIYKIKSCRHI